jgi:hypothetical protein
MSYIFTTPASESLLDFRKIGEMVTWAKNHCGSYITINASQDQNGHYYYRFYFGQEQDFALFALRWL